MEEQHDFLHPDVHETHTPRVYGIDAISANWEVKTGVEWYAFHLIENLKKHALLPGERVILYSHVPLKGALADLPEGWESQVLEWPLPMGWMQCRMSYEMWRRPVDVLFVPSQTLPRFVPSKRQGKKTVTTIHDIGSMRHPEFYDSKAKRHLNRTIQFAKKKADHIITVSEFTKQEVAEVVGVAPERMSAIPLAGEACEKEFDPKKIDQVLQKHRLGHHFFLTIGRLEKKKNITTLLRAFDQFKTRRGVGDPFELVLVGKEGYGYAEIKALYDKLPHKKAIRQLGYLPADEMEVLQKVASAYVFPSWYEGFGIPNVEAMQCGMPLLTSDIPVHREVVGEAGVFVPPNNIDGWAKAMERIVDEPEWCDQLIQNGKEQAEQYSWEQTAKRTWEVLRNV